MQKASLIARRTASRVFLFVLLIVAASIGFAPITRSPVTEWDVALTASLDIYNDVSEFGVRNDATDGFDTAYDALDPPPPPGSGVVSYFWYPDNPASPVDLRKLSTSKIALALPMIWTYVVNAKSISGPLAISWPASQIALIPSEYDVYLQRPGLPALDMRSVTSFGFSADSDVTYTFTIQVEGESVLSLSSFPAPFVVERVVGVSFVVGGTHQHGPKNWQAWTVDVLGGICVAGRLGLDSDSGCFYQFVDTDVATYSDGTVTVDWSMITTHVIAVGSSFVNIFTYKYETYGGVPFCMTEVEGQPVIHSDDTGSDYGWGTGPPAYDHAVIALVHISSVERYVMLVYGVTGRGSQAACTVLQNYDAYTSILTGRAVIIRWEDTNLNGRVDTDDTITQIETWS